MSTSGAGSAYGAFGSLVAVVVWVYYTTQIVLFGAGFTRVYARRHDSGLIPGEGARAAPDAVEEPLAGDATPGTRPEEG